MNVENKNLTRFNEIVNDIRKQNYQASNRFMFTFFLMAACLELYDAGFDDPDAEKMIMVRFPTLPIRDVHQITDVSRYIRNLSKRSCEAYPPTPGERVEISPDCNGTGKWIPAVVFATNQGSVSVVEHITGRIFSPALSEIRRMDKAITTEPFKHQGFRKWEKVSPGKWT